MSEYKHMISYTNSPLNLKGQLPVLVVNGTNIIHQPEQYKSHTSFFPTYWKSSQSTTRSRLFYFSHISVDLLCGSPLWTGSRPAPFHLPSFYTSNVLTAFTTEPAYGFCPSPFQTSDNASVSSH